MKLKFLKKLKRQCKNVFLNLLNSSQASNYLKTYKFTGSVRSARLTKEKQLLERIAFLLSNNWVLIDTQIF